jgi:uncharacterized protein YdhG (YjbR/CyaY superfamily)
MQGRQNFNSIDEYIASFPETMQELLQQVRTTIRNAAPEATERISYGIPTFFLNGNLVHFGGYKSHVGFYPGAEGIEIFKDRLSSYPLSRGTVRFPSDQPIPFDLIREITEFRVHQNLGKKKLKKEKS